MNLPQHQSSPVGLGRLVVHNRSNSAGHSSLSNELGVLVGQYRAAAVEDMAHKAIRVEVEEFLVHFLKTSGPSSSNSPPTLDVNPFEGLANAVNMQESEISDFFVKAVSKHDLAPGLKMALSEHRPDKNDADKQKIDAAFFRPQFLPTDGRPHWEDQMVPVEFKAHDTAKDPYDDREAGTVDAYAQTRKQVRGQIIHYAQKIFEYQHRTSLIFLIVIGRRFRLSRWDRSGTIVTRAIDYVEHPQILCDALWHIGRMSDEELGLDPTAHRVLPGTADYVKMIRAKFEPDGIPDIAHTERLLDAFPPVDAVFAYVRKMFRKSIESTSFPWYRLEVPDGNAMRNFLVGRPVFCALGMAGRGTRGYVALDVDASPPRFVWLKDAWRTLYDLVAPEGAVLEELNAAGVINVPTLICHGDLPGQETVTPTWWELKNAGPTAESRVVSTTSPTPSVASSSRTLVNHSSSSERTKRSAFEMEEAETSREACPLRRHKHYRLVVKEVAMKLVEFNHGLQLVQVIFDCILAHQAAVTNANIMHRDISGGNILILPKATVVANQSDPSKNTIEMSWTGLLVDWELSKPLIGRAGLPRPRQPERTGTWQFMSAAVLSDHGKKIEISDELEAFFHVTLYYAVRYLRSNCVDVGAFIEDYFDSYTVEANTYKCGNRKSATMKLGLLMTTTNYDTPLKFGSVLDEVFSQALRWFKSHYVVEAYKRNRAAQSTTTSKLLPTPISRPTTLRPKRVPRASYVPKRVVAFSEQNKPLVEEPSAQMLEDAANLDTHDALLDMLYAAMTEPNWPQDRVADDNVPKNYQPRIPIGPPVVGSTVPLNKRQKTAPVAHGVNTPLTKYASSSEPPRTPPRRTTVV
ncbi:hypothetical protein BN946_scf184848.g2 [Trametes cinnabarina]|uniref:Fungal-type protein kinase domain-containing protein n=1 Tax=Pycnoporus cinnabarinus TaxID=5643 RepID=A0A060SLS8_PYCCI|nr:hypothetical protein BN946_scf184848.g2 [Trametes cinnabarina]